MYVGMCLSWCERGTGKSYNDKLVCARDGRWSRWESVAKRPDYGTGSERGAGTDGGEIKRGSYFPRIRKNRPYGRPAAEGRRDLVLEGLIARRASSRNRSSKSNSSRNTRKKQEPTWIRGRQKVVGKETEWEREKMV